MLQNVAAILLLSFETFPNKSLKQWTKCKEKVKWTLLVPT